MSCGKRVDDLGKRARDPCQLTRQRESSLPLPAAESHPVRSFTPAFSILIDAPYPVPGQAECLASGTVSGVSVGD
jgi:hypothetical protein